ncbi:MAG: hypothetical protein V1729_06485 [Candidatus Woesearchaeota archaeon]
MKFKITPKDGKQFWIRVAFIVAAIGIGYSYNRSFVLHLEDKPPIVHVAWILLALVILVYLFLYKGMKIQKG